MNSDAGHIVEIIKNIWPKMNITKENLAHPVSELVMRFYTHFLNELEDKLHCWTDPYYTSLNAINTDHLELEEQVFVRIAPLLQSLHRFEFKLCDIYEPTSVRTRIFFFICCHLIMFGDTIYEDIEKLTIEVIKIKDESVILLKKQEELLNEIKELATKKSELMDNLENIQKKLTTTEISYAEMKDIQVKQKKINSNKKKQIEYLKRELQQEEHEVNTLENLENALSEQITSKEEYQGLLAMLENIESELKTLGTDDDNMEDILVVENDISLHYQECLNRIPNINDFSTKMINSLLDSDKALLDLEIAKHTISSKNSHLNMLISQQKNKAVDLNQRLKIFLNEKHNLLTQYTDTKERLEKKLSNVEEQYKITIKYINSDTSDKAKSEEHMKQLKEYFAIEYIKLFELDRNTKDYYNKLLLEMQINI